MREGDCWGSGVKRPEGSGLGFLQPPLCGCPIWPQGFLGCLGLGGDIIQPACSSPTIHTVAHRPIRRSHLAGLFQDPADPGHSFLGLFPGLGLNLVL